MGLEIGGPGGSRTHDLRIKSPLWRGFLSVVRHLSTPVTSVSPQLRIPPRISQHDQHSARMLAKCWQPVGVVLEPTQSCLAVVDAPLSANCMAPAMKHVGTVLSSIEARRVPRRGGLAEHAECTVSRSRRRCCRRSSRRRREQAPLEATRVLIAMPHRTATATKVVALRDGSRH